MTDTEPAEFATELLLPFTSPPMRESADPEKTLHLIAPEALRLRPTVEAFHHFFEICGARRFARVMTALPVPTTETARDLILDFTREEILEAASFHGDIGQASQSLDNRAAGEQALVFSDAESAREELRKLGTDYLKRFGFKFLISAQGKASTELKAALQARLKNDEATELANARTALWEISEKRMPALENPLAASLKEFGLQGASIAINSGVQVLSVGAVSEKTLFQIASLSKTVASAFALEYFRKRGIPLDSSVNVLLAGTRSPFRIPGEKGGEVQLAHCLNHSALNMHYVKGIATHERPESFRMPTALELLQGAEGYAPLEVRDQPGKTFGYSGGGFIVIEHLIQAIEESKGGGLERLTQDFLAALGIDDFTFDPLGRPGDMVATGHFDSGQAVPSGRLHFPAFAAGALATSGAVARFLEHLTRAFHSLEGSGPISHDTAVLMLHGRDLGSRAFMGCSMGLGVFTLEAGANRFAVHQGANEGFRALFLHCTSGPDQGKGFVILCNGDNRAVPYIARTAQWLLKTLEIQGIDYTRMKTEFNAAGVDQEQIVNKGYKELLFDAFEADLPEPIARDDSDPRDPLADHNLAVGARVLETSNQKFSRAENLLSPFTPVFDPELFERQGKVMDSWESVRHNAAEFDHLLIELKKPAPIAYLNLSTRFHDGNHPEQIQVRGLAADGDWVDLFPRRGAEGHSLVELRLPKPAGKPPLYSRIEVRMYPDGGLSRLGLFSTLPPEIAKRFTEDAQFIRYPDPVPKSRKPLTIPFTEAANSHSLTARVIGASNEHYGPASQVISPYRPLHMFDGLESARSREPAHHEEVTIGLRKATQVARIVLDFTFFVNNNPNEVAIDGRLDDGTWIPLAPRTPTKAFAGNLKAFDVQCPSPLNQIRVKTFPDGGINRIRVFAPTPVA